MSLERSAHRHFGDLCAGWCVQSFQDEWINVFLVGFSRVEVNVGSIGEECYKQEFGIVIRLHGMQVQRKGMRAARAYWQQDAIFLAATGNFLTRLLCRRLLGLNPLPLCQCLG